MLRWLCMALLLSGVSAIARGAIPRAARQLIVVETAEWSASQAVVRRFERVAAGGAWKEVAKAEPALVGRNGLAWGRGLHAVPAGAVQKREGDGCAPAGIFRLGTAFVQPGETWDSLWPCVRLGPGHEAVDDVASRYYNQLVERGKVRKVDWRSSEKMLATPAYAMGVWVEHNAACVPGAGSCIYLHLWLGERQGTAGCTVLRKEALHALSGWLDAARHPVLVQLPQAEMERFLPELKTTTSVRGVRAL